MINSATFFQQYDFSRLTPVTIRDSITQKYNVICTEIKGYSDYLVSRGVSRKEDADLFYAITSSFAFFLLFIDPNTVSEYEYITCSYLLNVFQGWPEDMTKANFIQLLRQIAGTGDDTNTYEMLMKKPSFEQAVAEFGALLYASNGPMAKPSIKERLMNNKFIKKCGVFY